MNKEIIEVKEKQREDFEEAIKQKAVDFMRAVIEDDDDETAQYDSIYEIATLAKKVLDDENFKEKKINENDD